MSEERDPSVPPRWQILLGIEVVALMIALVTPVTPSKTGSRWSPAELVFDDPTYLHDVLVYFVLTNALLLVLAAVVAVSVAVQGAGDAAPDRTQDADRE